MHVEVSGNDADGVWDPLYMSVQVVQSFSALSTVTAIIRTFEFGTPTYRASSNQ